MTDHISKCIAAGLKLEHATKRHAREMARIVRPEDAKEMWASGKLLPEQGVRASINRATEAWAAYVGPDLLAVFGVTDYQNGWAAPWVISSIHVNRYPLTYFRASKVVIDHYRSQYPQMVQMISAEYHGALRWVERLGFRLRDPEPFGWRGALFCRVEMLTPKLILEVA